MSLRKKNFFALTFSDRQVCLVQTDRKGKVVLALNLKIDSGLIERGRVKKPQELTQVLAKLLLSRKLKGKFVVAGLPETASFSRVLDLPRLSREELDDAVRWQIEPLLPMPLEETCLDWMILEEKDQGFRILVMAFPTKIVEDYAQILENLNFQPVAFEPTSLSLSRLIATEKREKSALVVEIEKEGAVLVVVGPHGEIEISSTVSLTDGEGKKELFSTIEELLVFYKKKFGKEREVVTAFLCGSGADEKIASEIKTKNSLEAKMIPIKPLGLAGAVSLAKKNIAAPADEKTINLIPPRIQGVYDLAQKKKTLSRWVKFWLFSLFLIFFSFSVSAARIYFDLKKIEGDLIEIQALMTPEMKEAETKARTIMTKSSRVLGLIGSQKQIVYLVRLIEGEKAEGIDYTHFSVDFEREEIFLNGLASNQNQLLALREKLEKTNHFGQVRIPLSSLEREENINFTIGLTIKQED